MVQNIVICRGLKRGWTRVRSGKKPGQAGVQELFRGEKKKLFFLDFPLYIRTIYGKIYIVF